MYKEVIAEMTPVLNKKFPKVDFQWFQSGSENVAARMNAELSTGKTLADLVMTSDPFWYLELKNSGHLLSYFSTVANRIPNHFRDTDGAFTVVRIPVGVIAYNSSLILQATAPTAWSSLIDPRWKGKISMGSPLESGTSFSIVAQLAKHKGWKFFESLRKNELLSAGGNSAVISRMETKERPIGIVLLENVLEAQKRKSPIVPVYPTDGNILIPSPLAILSRTKHPDLARQVYDFLLSDEAQAIIVRGRMYSPIVSLDSPESARAFKLVLATSLQWNPRILEEIFKQREEIKKRFLETVLN